MDKIDPCPKHACGFWGIPLEKLDSLKDISEDKYECCLWHEAMEKCSRNPRFSGDPTVEDYFDPVPDELQDEDEEGED